MNTEEPVAEAPAPVNVDTEGADADEPSRWPQPIPEEWKQGRSANADAWFEQQKEELHRRYLEGKQAVGDAAAQAEAAAAATAAYEARIENMVKEQQAFSRSVQQQLSVLRQQRLQANLEYEALRLPHFTPPRPLALVTAPDGGPTLLERLFNRALATTLMTAVALAPGATGLGAAAAGPSEAVWCEQGQSRVSMQDPPLARAEALERCRMALVVLSPALMASPQWAIERRILTARLAAPPGTWPGAPLSAVLIVRLHVPPPASVGAAAAAAVKGLGRKAAAAVAAATAAAAEPDPAPPPPLALPQPVPGYAVQSYPVTVMDLTVPLPAEDPGEGLAAATALAQLVRDTVFKVLDCASSSGALRSAGLRLLPDPPPVHLHPAHVHAQPEQLLAATYGSGSGAAFAAEALTATLTMGASLAGAGSSSSLTTQLLASPARAAVAAGPAATAAHLLPSLYTQRAVEDWTMYDTTVWLASLGRSLERWTPGFLALAVDGPLLAVADDTDLRAACGVASDKAVAVLREALNSALRRPSLLPAARELLPGPDAPATPLPPEAAVMPPQQRSALLADICVYFDQDHSGDLNLTELNRLVQACGLRLSEERLKDVLDDYDDDYDGRLSLREAERLLEDVWRLVMAQQDLAAWTPSDAAAALKDAMDLVSPLETPRATPDADRGAAAGGGRTVPPPPRSAAATSAGSGGGRDSLSRPDTASDTASINILGGAVSHAPTPRGRGSRSPASRGGGGKDSVPPSTAGSGSTLPSTAAPRFINGGVGGVSRARTAAPVPVRSSSPQSAAATGGGGGTTTAPSTAGPTRSGSATRRPASSAPPVPVMEGLDETGARVRLMDRTYSIAATRGSGGSGGTGDGEGDGGGDGGGLEDDEDGGGSEVSYKSYGWGLPPRLPLASTLSMATKRFSDAGSVSSGQAPWTGAITPRVGRPGARSALSPEEMAARDIDVQQLLRKERMEAQIQDSLAGMLDCLDLRRRGCVELQMLRASLASAGPPNHLTPLHTQLLADLAESQAQLPTGTTAPATTNLHGTRTGNTNGFGSSLHGNGTANGSTATGTRRWLLASGPLGEVLLGLEVPVHSYITAGVKSVVSAQTTLMSVVYGDRGMSAMLRQLYRQTTGPDDPLELLRTGPRVQAKAAEAALEALMEVQHVKPTALIRAALLPSHQSQPVGLAGRDRDQEEVLAEDLQAALAAAAAAGRPGAAAAAALLLRCGPTPLSLHSARRYPQSWASATAHVLHVYQVLLRKCG